MNYIERFKVASGTEVGIRDVDPDIKGHHENHKEAAEENDHYLARLQESQDRIRRCDIAVQYLERGEATPSD